MIAIIDSGVGNIRSVANAFEHIGASFKVTTKTRDLQLAEKIIFPGVGAFCDGMKAITSSGLLNTLYEEVVKKGKLYLGICLGMQLLANDGHEDGMFKGLGWIPGTVRIIKSNNRIKLPHIGWNNVDFKKESALFQNLPVNSTFYFVHSYILEPNNPTIIAATCDYGENFVASIQHKNIYGVQFHPEKSQNNGLQLLKNFASINP